jgi:hypothetical protein
MGLQNVAWALTGRGLMDCLQYYDNCLFVMFLFGKIDTIKTTNEYGILSANVMNKKMLWISKSYQRLNPRLGEVLDCWMSAIHLMSTLVCPHLASSDTHGRTIYIYQLGINHVYPMLTLQLLTICWSFSLLTLYWSPFVPNVKQHRKNVCDRCCSSLNMDHLGWKSEVCHSSQKIEKKCFSSMVHLKLVTQPDYGKTLVNLLSNILGFLGKVVHEDYM